MRPSASQDAEGRPKKGLWTATGTVFTFQKNDPAGSLPYLLSTSTARTITR
jgi:hypothetical protein